MSTVIVLGTFHTEVEACTSQELLRIVKQISPEIVFCEAPPEIFPDMIAAEKNFNTPEIKVIRELLKESNIKIIPVDVYGIAVDDKRMDEIFDWFGEKMENYENAVNIQIHETYEKGYYFLNSKANDKINFDKKLMEREMVLRENNKELSLDYIKWVKWNNYRENQWIELIHEYFYENKFNSAVLMVGSAHRVGLLHKIMELEFKDKSHLTWNFNYLSN
ncbi:hypothetical protein [Abyssalbus ytuae]|uniref:Uncharacterized protein n=1 Tax=Abyssalbus ytuae TaxID=2926907 RepID=A0A9E7CU34_9FLAO|nr:hypothetical protein [Abyssalbus ytuae]UOB17517.1 hypothetical protein MQE35_17490 [Abyssalbus ytuae]